MAWHLIIVMIGACWNTKSILYIYIDCQDNRNHLLSGAVASYFEGQGTRTEPKSGLGIHLAEEEMSPFENPQTAFLGKGRLSVPPAHPTCRAQRKFERSVPWAKPKHLKLGDFRLKNT